MFCFGVVLYGMSCCRVFTQFSALSVSTLLLSLSHTHALTHTLMYTHTHIHTDTHTHAETQRHAQASKQTNTHTREVDKLFQTGKEFPSTKFSEQLTLVRTENKLKRSLLVDGTYRLRFVHLFQLGA